MTPPSSAGRVFVFPGQGSQSPGMARELAPCGAAGADLVDEASHVTGLPVRRLMTSGDAATIADPHVAQVLVFVSSYVWLRHLESCGVRPTAVAGHSLGEYTALVAAGCLDWADALPLVAARGRAMAAAAAAAPGAMAAIVGLPLERVEDLCAGVSRGGPTVGIANVNSPRQAVVSGAVPAVEAVVAGAQAAGAFRARRLPVGGAYHTTLMAPAEQSLAPALAAAPLRPPSVPFVTSMTGQRVTCMERYRAELLRQVTSPVRWDRTVVTLAATDPGTFVEVGPGRVLSGLGREMVRSAHHLTALEAAYLQRHAYARAGAAS